MSIMYLKSLLSLPLILLALIGMYTMFEVFGRKEKRYSINKLKTIHRWNGYIFLILFSVIAYLCIDLLMTTGMALDARTTFHVVFALVIFLLLLVKISYVRVYTLFYPQVKTFGLTIALLAIVLTAISGGYYLTVSVFGIAVEDNVQDSRNAGEEPTPEITLKTDQVSIGRGRAIFQDRCILCHDPESLEPTAGRGLKGILQRERLPVSGRPATPKNIARQLRDPFERMPPFTDLTREQVEDIIAYLNTL
jgi:mono/diheme cytochrome c family protein